MSAVDSDRILEDLRKLWLDLAREDPNGVLRACTMTLIVLADEDRDAQLTGETLAALMHEHPSRAIVIRVRDTDEALLAARVFAQCWMPFGSRQQICCEQVEILSGRRDVAAVESVIRGIIAPDLPVALYAPSQSLWWVLEQGLLLNLAGKLIIDSCAMDDLSQSIGFLPTLSVARKADLVWSRITPIRECIAQVFDCANTRKSVYDLSEVRILYKASSEPSAVYYLAGWFMHVLGAGVKVKIARGVGPEYSGIADVTLVGPKLEASVSITGRLTAETTISGQAPAVTVLPVANEYYALRQELGITKRDALFEDVLGLANLMRGSG